MKQRINPFVLLDYIDPVRTTKAILRDYNDQLWKTENGRERIDRINSDMRRIAPTTFDPSPVQGGGSRAEEFLCAAIDKKTIAEYGYSRAVAFMHDLGPCWKRLSDEERFMLTARFVDADEGAGIKRIMDKYYLGKSEAYNRSNEALKRLAKLLFW